MAAFPIALTMTKRDTKERMKKEIVFDVSTDPRRWAIDPVTMRENTAYLILNVPPAEITGASPSEIHPIHECHANPIIATARPSNHFSFIRSFFRASANPREEAL